MNIEAAWAKLQESRKLEKKEELLKRQQQQKEKEEAEAAEAEAKPEEASTVKNEEGEGEGEQTNEKEDNNKSSEENVEGQNGEDDKKKDNVDNNTEEKVELENSVGSLGASTTTLTDDNTQSKVLEGILDKKAKYLLWEEIKASSMYIFVLDCGKKMNMGFKKKRVKCYNFLLT